MIKFSTELSVDNSDRTLMFEPAQQELEEHGLQLEPSVVKPQRNGTESEWTVSLVIENPNAHPIFLPANQLIGYLQPARCLSQDEAAKVLHSQVNFVSSNSHVNSIDSQQRCKAIWETVHVDKSNLQDEECTALEALMKEYTDLFALTSAEIGRTNLVHHTINTGDNAPVKQPPRRIPFALRPKVEEMISEMLDQGAIQESFSPWASPIVLVSKPDGSSRFYVDYRRLNAVTKTDEFPLPRVDDCLDMLSGMKYFSALDMASRYWQVAMSPEFQEKTAFITHEGLYEFCVMPFGLSNAPAMFQRLMHGQG